MNRRNFLTTIVALSATGLPLKSMSLTPSQKLTKFVGYEYELMLDTDKGVVGLPIPEEPVLSSEGLGFRHAFYRFYGDHYAVLIQHYDGDILEDESRMVLLLDDDIDISGYRRDSEWLPTPEPTTLMRSYKYYE